jgi:CRISPR/Cas system-associated endoribonuclease Cas2
LIRVQKSVFLGNLDSKSTKTRIETKKLSTIKTLISKV